MIVGNLLCVMNGNQSCKGWITIPQMTSTLLGTDPATQSMPSPMAASSGAPISPIPHSHVLQQTGNRPPRIIKPTWRGYANSRLVLPRLDSKDGLSRKLSRADSGQDGFAAYSSDFGPDEVDLRRLSRRKPIAATKYHKPYFHRVAEVLYHSFSLVDYH